MKKEENNKTIFSDSLKQLKEVRIFQNKLVNRVLLILWFIITNIIAYLLFKSI
jgi:hypothetical protein